MLRGFAIVLSGLWLSGLVACGPSSSGGSPVPAKVSGNISEAKAPVLKSSYFEKEWGAPSVSVMDDGTYRMSYQQGTTLNFVVIRSLSQMSPPPAAAPDWEEAYADPEGTRPAPPPHKQSWRQTKILGVPVKWYQKDGGSGADFPAYRTVDFSLTAPDGRVGFYRIDVFTDSTGKAADWIGRVNF